MKQKQGMDIIPCRVTLRAPNGQTVPVGYITFRSTGDPDDTRPVLWRTDARYRDDDESMTEYAVSRDLLLELGWAGVEEVWVHHPLTDRYSHATVTALRCGRDQENPLWGSIRFLGAQHWKSMEVQEDSFCPLPEHEEELGSLPEWVIDVGPITG